MQLLPHRCPHCGFVAQAPLAVLQHGAAGVWQCESCEQAFDIFFHFRPIDPEILNQKRDELRGVAGGFMEADALENDPDTSAENEVRQSLVIRQEIERLRQTIELLEEEARRLGRDESDS